MSCCRVLKSAGDPAPADRPRFTAAAERRRHMLKAPEKFNEVLQGDFTST